MRKYLSPIEEVGTSGLEGRDDSTSKTVRETRGIGLDVTRNISYGRNS